MLIISTGKFTLLIVWCTIRFEHFICNTIYDFCILRKVICCLFLAWLIGWWKMTNALFVEQNTWSESIVISISSSSILLLPTMGQQIIAIVQTARILQYIPMLMLTLMLMLMLILILCDIRWNILLHTDNKWITWSLELSWHIADDSRVALFHTMIFLSTVLDSSHLMLSIDATPGWIDMILQIMDYGA